MPGKKKVDRDPLTGKPLLEAVRCARCKAVVLEDSAQPITQPDGSLGHLCDADRKAALIPERTAEPVAIIVCTRDGAAVAASEATPVRIPAAETGGTPTIEHMCPACYARATSE